MLNTILEIHFVRRLHIISDIVGIHKRVECPLHKKKHIMGLAIKELRGMERVLPRVEYLFTLFHKIYGAARELYCDILEELSEESLRRLGWPTSQCNICYNDYSSRKQLRLTCGHITCIRCRERLPRNSCPFCRTFITSTHSLDETNARKRRKLF